MKPNGLFTHASILLYDFIDSCLDIQCMYVHMLIMSHMVSTWLVWVVALRIVLALTVPMNVPSEATSLHDPPRSFCLWDFLSA